MTAAHFFRTLASAALLLALGLFLGTPPGDASQGAPFGEDKGRLRVVVDGQPAGTEEFTISRSGNDWMARGTVDIPSAEGGVSKLSARLRFADDGSPIEYQYDWSPHGGKKISANVTFQDGTARMEAQMEGGKPFLQEFKFETTRIAILDNNLYHQYAILARLYDWEKKGSQSIPVLIPQDQTPATITVDYVGQQPVGEARYETLRVTSADLEIDAYYDSAHRLMHLAVPASKAEVIREPEK
jgi:hypothetical protein